MKATANANLPRVPSLKHHKASGQGYVRIDGRIIYIGKFGLPGTRQRYHQCIAEWMAGGYHLRVEADEITIVELCNRFRKYAERYYRCSDGTASKEVHHFRQAFKLLNRLYSRTPAVDFGPVALRTVRAEMIKVGWCRRHVNFQVSRIKRMFRWATENELIPGSVYHALQAVTGLRHGRSEARESKVVKPVPMEDVELVKPYVSRQVWAMIQLQLYTGARSGEMVILRPCDVDRSGKIWLYKPPEHKTAHYGHERQIYIGPRGQAVLSPFLFRPAEAYCFSPAEAEAERLAQLHAARKTPPSCGNRPGTNRKDNPKRSPGDHYTAHSYGRAVRYACEKAFPPPEPLAKREDETYRQWRKRLTAGQKKQLLEWWRTRCWHPHQLRHSAATELRKDFGLETARIVLGHRSPAITTIYAEEDKQKAIEAMARIG